jgi:hypothetical protein
MLPIVDQRMSAHARLMDALSKDKDSVLFWNLFRRSTTPPLDLRAAAAALRGAKLAIHIAYTILSEPNAKAISLLAKVAHLQETLQRVHSECQVEDLDAGIRKTLASYPQWRLLATAGDLEFDGNALQFGAGVELALALANDRKMATNWCKVFRCDKSLLNTKPTTLQAALIDLENPLRSEWSTRLKKNLAEFIQTFDNIPPHPTKPRSFDERVKENWRSKAAFATQPARAAVLDDRCLSLQQFRKAMQHRPDSPYERDEYLAAIYFTGFCGLSPNLVGEIPISQQAGEQSACELEFTEDGVTLVRDFECLADDAAKPAHIDGIPASSVLRTPLPRNISTYLTRVFCEHPNATHLRALLPQLASLNSRERVYSTAEQPTPSWARLRPTLGRILRQEGIDGLQVALLTADFSHAAKSKVYYATLSQTEVNAAAVQAYRILGFELPAAITKAGIAFGSQVTPTTRYIHVANEALIRGAEQLRPGRNCGRAQLIQFHNAYSLVIGFRLMALLALRETSNIHLPSIDDDTIIYLTEKSSAGRAGGMAAIVPELLTDQIKLYAAHCQALNRRLSAGSASPFQRWLVQAVNGQAPLELRVCSTREAAHTLRSADVLRAVHSFVQLAPDFGRKLMENLLRSRGIRTEDIDRTMRHEVAGQEACAGVSDASELAWRKRLCPSLNCIAIELFNTPLSGLAKELK